MLRAKLLEYRELAPEVRHFEFEVPGVERLDFMPGQFISIVERLESKEITRAYSIASPRSGNRFALCLNHVPDGAVSTYMFSLKPGDEVEIREPLGYFTLRHPSRRALFVATGTGVAPFRSMLLEHLPSARHPMTLLFGVRHENGLLYLDEFQRLQQDYPLFEFLPTLTRPTNEWRGLTGRVQQHLDAALNVRSDEERDLIDVYVCGLKEMVDGVRALLKSRGFDRKQIIYEKYD